MKVKVPLNQILLDLKSQCAIYLSFIFFGVSIHIHIHVHVYTCVYICTLIVLGLTVLTNKLPIPLATKFPVLDSHAPPGVRSGPVIVSKIKRLLEWLTPNSFGLINSLNRTLRSVQKPRKVGFFCGASRQFFWKPNISSSREKYFQGFLAIFLLLNSLKKKCFSTKECTRSLSNGVATASNHAFWCVLSNKAMWVLSHCWVDTSHLHATVFFQSCLLSTVMVTPVWSYVNSSASLERFRFKSRRRTHAAGGALRTSWPAGVSMRISYHSCVRCVRDTAIGLGARRERNFKCIGWDIYMHTHSHTCIHAHVYVTRVTSKYAYKHAHI